MAGTRQPRRRQFSRPRRSARAQALAEWRGVDWEGLERAQANAVRPVGAVLPEVLAGLRLEERQLEAGLVKAWNQSIDPQVTAHAQPAGWRRGTLFVNVDSSVWLAEIVRYRQREILERLQLAFGCKAIRRISFRIG